MTRRISQGDASESVVTLELPAHKALVKGMKAAGLIAPSTYWFDCRLTKEIYAARIAVACKGGEGHMSSKSIDWSKIVICEAHGRYSHHVTALCVNPVSSSEQFGPSFVHKDLKAQFASSTPMQAYSEEIDRLRAAIAEKDAAMDWAAEHLGSSYSEWWLKARRAGHNEPS